MMQALNERLFLKERRSVLHDTTDHSSRYHIMCISIPRGSLIIHFIHVYNRARHLLLKSIDS